MPAPVKKHLRCEILSWNSVARDAKKLSGLIKNSGYHPNIVIAIARVILVMRNMNWNFLEAKMFLIQKFIYETWIVILFASIYLVIHAVVAAIQSVSTGPIYSIKEIARFFAILGFMIVITRWYTMLTVEMKQRISPKKREKSKKSKKKKK